MPEGFYSKRYGANVSQGLRDLDRDIRASRERTMLAIMTPLHGQIVEELSQPGTGRVRWGRIKTRTRSGRRRAITAARIARAGRASAPGEPPAADTGKLRGSIQMEYDRSTQKGRVGTNDKKAAPLNFGTRRAGRNRRTVILPRPFMEPALKKSQIAMAIAGQRAHRLALHSRRGNASA